MWAPDDFDLERHLVPLHLAEMLEVAAEDRRARVVRPTIPGLAPAGVVLIAFGQALIRAGECMAGVPAHSEAAR